MSDTLRKILTIEAIITATINGIINAIFAWFLNKNNAFVDVSFWPLIINLFITCHIICLICTQTANLSAKRYKNLGMYTENTKLVNYPSSPLLMGFLLADIFSLICSLILGVVFSMLNITTLPLHIFIVYKAVLGAFVGATASNVSIRRFLLRKNN